jgi:hypothetical protein
MAIQDPTARADFLLEEVSLETNTPTVSWGAIFAGAFSAAALSFVLLAVGAAFGPSVASPWDFNGRDAADTAAAAGIGAAIFLIVVHAISSGTGGYLAGRLRPKPTALRGDETYFRDTAPGLGVAFFYKNRCALPRRCWGVPRGGQFMAPGRRHCGA